MCRLNQQSGQILFRIFLPFVTQNLPAINRTFNLVFSNENTLSFSIYLFSFQFHSLGSDRMFAFKSSSFLLNWIHQIEGINLNDHMISSVIFTNSLFVSHSLFGCLPSRSESSKYENPKNSPWQNQRDDSAK